MGYGTKKNVFSDHYMSVRKQFR